MIKKIVGLLLAMFVMQFSMAYVIENNHKGVQLWAGGPYWAETNIGAQNSSDYGYYFWWGDTVGYKRVNGEWVASNGSSSNFWFDEASVPTYNKSDSTLQSEGWITSSGVLAPSHDAARAHWGSNWRMPTDCELQSLVDNCTWTWTTKNGVYGREVRGKGNYSGASIFLPAAGFSSDSYLNLAGSYGFYWSSVPNSSDSRFSWGLDCGSSLLYMENEQWRLNGLPVRPVLDTPSYGTPSCTIVFNANGGYGSMSSQVLAVGTTDYIKINRFKRTGYTFLGWARSKTGSVVFENGESIVNNWATGTVTFYAVWAKTKYKIAFYANGGSGKMSAQTMTYNKAAYLKKNAFKRTGYTFAGWAKSSTGSVVYSNGKAVKNLTRTGGTVKLYAKWKPITYKVVFYGYGGMGSMSAQTIQVNKAAYLKKNAFTRTGYTFLGWAKSAALAKKGKIAYKNRQVVKNLLKKSGIVKLIAVWKPITYKVVFYPNGGSGKAIAQSMTYNKAAYLKKNIYKRSGYIFLGWAKSKNGAVAYKNAQAVKNLRSTKGTIKLYAVWAKTTYKVAFYANGGSGSMSAQSMTYNKAAYLKKNTFKRTGYTFAGWAKSSTGSVVYSNGKAVKNLTRTGGTIKLYAKWTPITYKVTFYPNGGTGSAVTQTMTYNKAAYLRSNTFKRTGYTFKGWAKSPTGSVVYTNGKAVKNLTTTGGTIKLYAVWEISGLSFLTAGDAGWSYVSDDKSRLQSGEISNSEYSSLYTSVIGSGIISFNWKVSSENGYDWLSFYVDDELVTRISGTDQSWQYFEYKITGSGTHEIEWEYRKDGSSYSGDDCGWVDNVVWTSQASKDNQGVQLWENGPYWAETNVGAENPEDYGYYFWWGDTIGYKRVNDQWVASDGSSSNFSFYDYNTPTYGKSNSTLQSEGWITSSGVLASSHDAARAHWGSNWRMPTYSEMQDLCDNCTWTWTTKNGVNGYVVSGKGAYSGASIFLPAAGYGSGTSLYGAYSYVYCWSSNPTSVYNYYSWYLYFDSTYYFMSYGGPDYGYPVRPVLDVH